MPKGIYTRPKKELICIKCGVVLDEETWPNSCKNGHHHICANCYRKQQRDFSAKYRTNPQKRKIINERSRKYAITHPEKRRKLMRDRLYRKHGVSPENYKRLYDFQKGCCAICERHQSELIRALDIDHNHITKTIRSLLCSKCNLLIGNIESNFSLVNPALNYLKAWEMLEGKII